MQLTTPSRATLAMAVALGFAASAANASLVLTEPGEFSGNSILAIQSPGDATFEQGSVFITGIGSPSSHTTGDVVLGLGFLLTRTRSLGELGLTSASSLRVVFRADEPAGTENGITLSNLVLTIYSFMGAPLFTSGAFPPVSFADTSTGASDLGFVFALDAQQAQAAQAAAFTGPFFSANIVGLSAGAGQGGAAPAGLAATGGYEIFFVGAGTPLVPAIPEPEAYSLMIAGLGLVGFIACRRKVRQRPPSRLG